MQLSEMDGAGRVNLHRKTGLKLVEKTLWALFMNGIQLPQCYRALQREIFLTTKSPEIPGILAELGRMKR